MTTKEKIEIMQAYINGKTIELMHADGTWHEVTITPSWNWEFNHYRIKPEFKLRPYENAKEFLQAQKEHGPYLTACGQYLLPILIDHEGNKGVVTGSIEPDFSTYEELFKLYTWQDGNKCGICE